MSWAHVLVLSALATAALLAAVAVVTVLQARRCPKCRGRWKTYSRGLDLAINRVAALETFQCDACGHRWKERL